MDDKLVRMSDAISAILEEKISGQQLEIMRELGTGMQVETLNQACDRHAQLIRDLPAVDAVEVVRCRECIHSDTYPEGVSTEFPLKCLDIRYGGVSPDWYCEHGQRREDGDA